MPQLGRIAIYPIKSLDPDVVNASKLVEHGALEFDREYALFSAQGKWIRAKQAADLHRLRATYSHHYRNVDIQIQGTEERFHFPLNDHNEALNDFLSGFLEQPVIIRRNSHGGFPDEMNARPGPTIISKATLETVVSWYPGKTLDEMRLRFRANLEIDGVPPFWEDQLVGPLERQPRLRIGNVIFHTFHPCARCAVVTRHPHTGQSERAFQQTFTEMRQKTLGVGTSPEPFDHFFRLAVRTNVDKQCWSSELKTGDEVELLPAAER